MTTTRRGATLMQTPSRTPLAVRTPARRTTTASRPLGRVLSDRKNTPTRQPLTIQKSTRKKHVLFANSGEDHIKVAIRMRPLNRRETSHKASWTVLGNTIVASDSRKKAGSKEFSFDNVFADYTTTEQVYNTMAKDIVSDSLKGLNGTIVAYGQTSSGKTYTMQGAGTIQDGIAGGGIIQRAVNQIFDQVENAAGYEYVIRVSFLEVYNEKVRDLLNFGETIEKNSVERTAAKELVTDPESLLSLLAQGEECRSIGATSMNERSSRSHTIFSIIIESRQNEILLAGNDENCISSSPQVETRVATRVSTLNLVDLAGSENAKLTEARGDRQREGGMINKSLTVFDRVIKALGDGSDAHIPFRDSCLTLLLKPSLEGNSRVSIICCATSSSQHHEVTKNTFLFAERARKVKTDAKVNLVPDEKSMICELKLKLEQAKLEIESLQSSSDASSSEEMEELQKKYHSYQRLILNSTGPLFYGMPHEKSRKTLPKIRMSDVGFVNQQAIETPREGSQNPTEPQSVPKESKYVSPPKETALWRLAVRSKRNEVSDKQKAIQELQRRNQTLQSEQFSLGCSNDTLRSECEDLRNKVNVYSKEVQEMASRLDRATNSHKLAIEEKNTEIQLLCTRTEQQQEELKQSKEKVKELEAERDNLQKQVLAHSSKAESITSELEINANEYKLALEEKKVEIEQLHRMTEEQKVSLEESQAQIDTLISERDELESKLLSHVEKADELMAQLDAIKHSHQLALDEKDKLLKESQDTEAELRSKLDDIEKQMITISEKADKLNNKLQDTAKSHAQAVKAKEAEIELLRKTMKQTRGGTPSIKVEGDIWENRDKVLNVARRKSSDSKVFHAGGLPFVTNTSYAKAFSRRLRQEPISIEETFYYFARPAGEDLETPSRGQKRSLEREARRDIEDALDSAATYFWDAFVDPNAHIPCPFGCKHAFRNRQELQRHQEHFDDNGRCQTTLPSVSVTDAHVVCARVCQVVKRLSRGQGKVDLLHPYALVSDLDKRIKKDGELRKEAEFEKEAIIKALFTDSKSCPENALYYLMAAKLDWMKTNRIDAKQRPSGTRELLLMPFLKPFHLWPKELIDKVQALREGKTNVIDLTNDDD